MSSLGTGLPPRRLADRCPGLLRPHVAEDGLLVRLRVPGGQTSAAVLLELATIAAEFGEGSLQLTSRGNVQLRGLDALRLPDLVDQVAALGLLPSVTHERVRNVVASPLTGLDPERPDLRPLVTELDAALCAAPDLAELPGRFLFAVDDGRGDVTSLAFDLAFRADGPTTGTVLVGSRRAGLVSTRAEAVPTMIGLARRFLRSRTRRTPPPWHISELADVTELDPRVGPVPDDAGPSVVPLGRVGAAASVRVPLSLLSRPQLEVIHQVTGGDTVVITPWRGLVLPGAADALPPLADAGLTVDEASAWSSLSACIGGPSCARSAINTRAVATGLAADLDRLPRLPVHISGCERRCGAPAGDHIDLVAPRSVEQAMAAIERRP